MNDKVPLAQQSQSLGGARGSLESELDTIKGRLNTLERAHADLNIAFHELKTSVAAISGTQSLETQLGQQLVAVRAQLAQLLSKPEAS